MIRHDWTIYCDGSHKEGKTSGAWRLVNTGTAEVIRGSQSFGEGTVNTAELNAIICALRAVPTPADETRVVVYTDSEWSIKSIKGEYNAKSHLEMIGQAQTLLRSFRSAGISHTPAHVGNAGNEEVDRMAKAAREKSQAFEPDVHIIMREAREGLGTTSEVVGIGDDWEGAEADARKDGHPIKEEGVRYRGSKYCLGGRK